ncbi:MAG: hypothetical protein Unbinned1524contig1001_56 [Prokaryotic dsDNA virus sp.]|mgnify:CR=1 FL=1|nr:MAG: hypothetical protein Unbinned1524contig1001_56 [Prokaryotic dsDNA virus sp.]|tara:strand:- start:29336 stop:31234 length:1899 start_codon:yes stop_codon:yes gene_type:complete
MAKLRYDRYGNRLDEEGNPVSYSSGGTTYNPVGEVTYGGASTGGYHPSVPKSVRNAGNFRTPGQRTKDRIAQQQAEHDAREEAKRKAKEERERSRKGEYDQRNEDYANNMLSNYGVYEPPGLVGEDGQPIRRDFGDNGGNSLVEDDIRNYAGKSSGKVQYYRDPNSGKMQFVVKDPGSEYHNLTASADAAYYDGVKIRSRSDLQHSQKTKPSRLHGMRTPEELKGAVDAHENMQGTSPEEWDLADAKFNYASGDPRGDTKSPSGSIGTGYFPSIPGTSPYTTNSTAQNLRSPYSIKDEYEEDFDWGDAGVSGATAGQNLPLQPGDNYEAEMMEDFDWGYSSSTPGDTRSQEELKMAHALGDPTVTPAGLPSTDPALQGRGAGAEMRGVYEDWKGASDAAQAGKNLWDMGKRGVEGTVEAAENLYDSVKESDAMDLLNPGARSPLKPTWPYIGSPEGSYLPGVTPVPEREPPQEGLFKSTWPYINVGDATGTGAYMPSQDPGMQRDVNPIYPQTHFESPSYRGPVAQAEGASPERVSPPTPLEILANAAIQRGSSPQAAPMPGPSTFESTRPIPSEVANPLSTSSVIQRVLESNASPEVKEMIKRLLEQGVADPLKVLENFSTNYRPDRTGGF